jgi:hypothetical protein
MSNDNYMMIQCKMSKIHYKEQSVEFHTAWIPQKFAFCGRSIDLGKGDDFDPGWTVIEVFDKACFSNEIIRDRAQDYKRTRKASDI